MKKACKKGLLLVFTGNGKGKTTSALGLTLRACGHHMKIAFFQFIKGSWPTGEAEALKRYADCVDFHILGRGFTWKSDDVEKDKALAKKGWDMAKRAISSSRYDLIILDEFTYLLKYSMIDLEDACKALRERSQKPHIVITGRDAPSEIIDMADLVTEMKEIKHPFKRGIKAQKGIEY